MASKPRWAKRPTDYVKAIESLAFEGYHLGLFVRICKKGVVARERQGYERSRYDHAFETCLYVHLRNVFDFLYPRKTFRPSDVLWHDFVVKSAFTPLTISGQQHLRNNLDQRVAHLTSARFKQPQPVSESKAKDGVGYYVEHGEQLVNVLSFFIQHLRTDWQDAYKQRFAEFEKRNQSAMHLGPGRHFLDD